MRKLLVILVFIVCLGIFNPAAAGPEDVRFVPLTRLYFSNIDSYGWFKKCADTTWVGMELHNEGDQDCTITLPTRVHVATNSGTWYPVSNMRYTKLNAEITKFDGIINKQGVVANGKSFTGDLTLPAKSIYAVFFDVSGISKYSLYWDTYVFYTLQISSGSRTITRNITGGLAQRDNGCGEDKVCSAEVVSGSYYPNGSGDVNITITNNMPDNTKITAFTNVALSWTDASGKMHSQTVTDGVAWTSQPGVVTSGSRKTISGTLSLPVEITAASRELNASFSFHHPSSLFFGNFTAEAKLTSGQGIRGVINGSYEIDGRGSFTATVYNYQDTDASVTLPASGTVKTSDNKTSAVTLTWQQNSPIRINAQGTTALSGKFRINDTSLIHSNSSLLLSADLNTAGSTGGAAAGNVTRGADPNAVITSLVPNFCRDYTTGSKVITFRYDLKNEASIDIPVELATTLAVEGQKVNPVIRYTNCVSSGSSCFSRISDNKITLTAGETVSFYGEAALNSTLSDRNFSIYTSLIYRPDGVQKVLYVGKTSSTCGAAVPEATATTTTPPTPVSTTTTPTVKTLTPLTPTAETPVPVTPTVKTPTPATPTAKTPTAAPAKVITTEKFCRDYTSGSKTLSFVYSLKNHTSAIIPVQLAASLSVEEQPHTLAVTYTGCYSGGGFCLGRISGNHFNLYPGETAEFHGTVTLVNAIRKQNFQVKTSLLYTVNGETKAYYVGDTMSGCAISSGTAEAVTPIPITPTVKTPVPAAPVTKTPAAAEVMEVTAEKFCRDHTPGSSTLSFVYSLKNHTSSVIPVQLAATLSVEEQPHTLAITYTGCFSGGGSCLERIRGNLFNLYPGENAEFHGSVTLINTIRKQNFEVKTSLLYTANGVTKAFYVGKTTDACSSAAPKALGTDITFESRTIVSEDKSQAAMVVKINNLTDKVTSVIPGTAHLDTAPLNNYKGHAAADPIPDREGFVFSGGDPFILSGQSKAELYLDLNFDPSCAGLGEVPVDWTFRIGDGDYKVADTISFSNEQPKSVLPEQTEGESGRVPELFVIEGAKLPSTLPATGFSSHSSAQVLSVQPETLRYLNFNGMSLEIPSFNASIELVGVPLDGNNEWAVEWLNERAGILQGSALPGEGTTVIAAHNHLDQKDPGPFVNIRQLESGDRIFVTDASGKMIRYKVYENELIKPDNVAALYQALPGSLVLVTCENELAEGGYADRRIVYAEPLR